MGVVRKHNKQNISDCQMQQHEHCLNNRTAHIEQIYHEIRHEKRQECRYERDATRARGTASADGVSYGLPIRISRDTNRMRSSLQSNDRHSHNLSVHVCVCVCVCVRTGKDYPSRSAAESSLGVSIASAQSNVRWSSGGAGQISMFWHAKRTRGS